MIKLCSEALSLLVILERILVQLDQPIFVKNTDHQYNCPIFAENYTMRSILFILTLVTSSTLFGQDSLWMEKADSIVQLSTEQLGIPYKWATSAPNVSFDCSGFTSYVYTSVNVTCSRSSRAYGSLGREISLEECRKGDCIVFAGTAQGSKIPGHVGIVISNTEEGIKFIHCSSSSKHFGVVETDYHSSNYPKRFLSVRRLFE